MTANLRKVNVAEDYTWQEIACAGIVAVVNALGTIAHAVLLTIPSQQEGMVEADWEEPWRRVRGSMDMNSVEFIEGHLDDWEDVQVAR